MAKHSAAGLASLLTTASMALGVMLVVSVLLIMGIVSQSFEDNSRPSATT